MRRSKAFTLIELMIVVVIVGILAAAAVPIYRSFTSRAYETEIISGLSTLRTAARTYKAEHDSYPADKEALETAEMISSDDFADMKYVSYDEFSLTGDATTLTLTWTGDITGYKYTTVTMGADGSITSRS